MSTPVAKQKQEVPPTAEQTQAVPPTAEINQNKNKHSNPVKADVQVVLGSTNAGKLQACTACFRRWTQLPGSYHVKGVHVPSGVSDMPEGLAETMQGAKNRAKSALVATKGTGLGVGLESGVLELDGLTMDFCACAVFDGVRYYVGFSSGFPLPPAVAQNMAKGYNVAFAALGIPPDEKGDGVLGHMSNGLCTRPDQMAQCLDMALLQLQNQLLYPR